MELEFKDYVRKPFKIVAIEVTEENIHDIAKQFKLGKVEERESDGALMIQVPKGRVPNVNRVFVGYFVTKMGKNVRCYNRKVFFSQFAESDENWESWMNWANDVEAPEPADA